MQQNNGLYGVFKTDANLEKEGIVLEYGVAANGEALSIRIARAGGSNVAFSKLLEHKLKPYRQQLKHDSMDKDVADKLMREIYAETVVLGWANVTDENGVPLDFNKANVLKVLTDLPDLWLDIQQQSNKTALFREMLRKDDAGN